MTNDNQELNGLGGWLILVGFGLIFTPIRTLVTLIPIYYAILSDGTLEVLTSPASEHYIPYFGMLVLFELSINVLIVIASLILIYLFFTKHRLFPNAFIALMIFSLIFIVIDAWASTSVFPDEPFFDPTTIGEAARSFVGAIIWGPYLLISKRVKATFTRP